MAKPEGSIFAAALAGALVAIGMLVAPGVGSAQSNTVTIKRDAYGTPHVYAESPYGLFYGYGYAVAQDRLFSLDMARRSTQGQVAEVLGPESLDYDKKIRQEYDFATVKQQLKDLEPADRPILDGYAAGMNAWIAEVRKNPDTLMPKQFNDVGFEPADWSAYDVAMIFVGSMLHRFGDYNTELENQDLLNELIEKHGEDTARAIFEQINPFQDTSAPTTIPKGDWDPGKRASLDDASSAIRHARNATYAPLSQHVLNQAARIPLGADGGLQAIARSEWAAFEQDIGIIGGATGPMGFSAASNIVVLGKDKVSGAEAVLLNGPQFGWYNPAYTYSIGLHGAGIDVVGNSPFAYPMVEFGFNKDITWGSTWGAGDNVDLFRLDLNPDNPEEYAYKGGYRPFDSHQETIQVKGGDPVTITARVSVHGPVIAHDPGSGMAYAKRRGWAGFEIDTLFGWTRAGLAKNHEEWREQISRSALNVNWYYADKEGNIAYAFGGKYPRRAPGHDGRLPAKGDGSMDWIGLMPFDTNPQVLNPRTGYIANWNNKPAEGFPNPDMWWYDWAEADRIDGLTAELSGDRRLTSGELWDVVVRKASFIDVNARYFIPFIELAVGNLAPDDKARRAFSYLGDWDYLSVDRDHDGLYDETATAVFRTWLPIMLTKTFADDLPGKWATLLTQSGYPTPEQPSSSGSNIQTGTKMLLQSLRGPEAGLAIRYDFFNGADPIVLIRETLVDAVAALESAYGNDPKAWKLTVVPQPYVPRNFRGIKQAGDDEVLQNRLAMNRGTENNMTIFAGGGVTGFEVAPPGQSGFIAPDGKRAQHYDDQLKLYEDLQSKPVWLHREDVDKHTHSVTRLTY